MSKMTYPCELPRDVVSLTRPKEKPHRDHWILLAARDQSWDLVSVLVDPDGSVTIDDTDSGDGYRGLFAALGGLSYPRVSNWVLTFRSFHVLTRSSFIAALERGEIELERQRKLAGKQAGRGSVVVTGGMTELDLRVHARKIKLLDWSNFGVDPGGYVSSLDDLDGDICLRIFTDWLETQTSVGLSASRTSAPQIGWAKLRQSLGESDIHTSLDPDIRALERRCYYGGRCEPYRLGQVNEKCYLLDVRAAYAAACASVALPTQPLRYYPAGIDVDRLEDGVHASIAGDCVVETDLPLYPVRHLGRVLYPTGRFFTSLCGHEMSMALARGSVKEITRCVSYAPSLALESYARWYMSARDLLDAGGHGGMAASLKSTFNSSLGFLARKGREWREWSPAGAPPWWFGLTTDPDDAGRVVGAHVLGGECEFLRVGHEPRNCAPIAHAAICASARAWLWMLIDAAGQEHVVYCDTDGLIVTQAGHDALSRRDGLRGSGYGQLGVRAEGPSCWINGQKNYRIGDKIVCAGLTAALRHTWRARDDLATPTGVVDSMGRVRPHVMSCEDIGDERPAWKNTLRATRAGA